MSLSDPQERTCRLCTQQTSDNIDVFSEEYVHRGVAEKMANVLDIPLEQNDGLSSCVCQLCYARFKHLLRTLEVNRVKAQKSHEKLAKSAGIFFSELPEDPKDSQNGFPEKVVEDAKENNDPLVQAADMTSVDLGSLLSDLVAAKQRMREQKGVSAEKRVVPDDIKDLMDLLSGVKDWFNLGIWLGVPIPRLHDIEHNYPGEENLQRRLSEVVISWINVCPEKATWPTLVEALTEMGRRKNAQEVAEKRGIVLPGVFDEGSLWKALKALIPIQEGGTDLVSLLDETEQLRKDVKTKDALLLNNEERLEAVNMQRVELEKQYSEALQRLEEEKEKVEKEKAKAKKELEEKEEQLRMMRKNRTADKETIENLEIEIMYLRKKLENQQIKERELVKEMVELQSKLDENQLSSLAWIADNLEKQIEGVQPEFEMQRSQMMSNIYKLLTYVKIPEDIEGEEVEEKGSPDPEIVVDANLEKEGEPDDAENMEEEEEAEMAEGDGEAAMEEPQEGEEGVGEDISTTEVGEEIEQETASEPEPTDVFSLLSSLEQHKTHDKPTRFGDKPFEEEDLTLASSLFTKVPAVLLGQILSIPIERLLAIEANDPKDEEKQRTNVLREWQMNSSGTTWSVLVEVLTELGSRSSAQTACIEKGVLLPAADEDGPFWQQMKEALSEGSTEVVKLLSEVELIRPEIKAKDEEICGKEAILVQARYESEQTKASLHKTRTALAAEIAECKSLEKQLAQTSSEAELAKQNTSESPAAGGEGGEKQLEQLELEFEGMKEKHRMHMSTIQSLWKEGEEKEKEDVARTTVVEPLEDELNQLKNTYSEERETLLDKMQRMYNLLSGRDEQEKLGEMRRRSGGMTKPLRPPPPKPQPPQLPMSPPPTPGYKSAAQLNLPSTDPVLPTGYMIMDLFHPNNTFCLLPRIDVSGRPVVVSSSLFTGTSLKGRGNLAQECVFTAEPTQAPWVLSLLVPNRGRVMVDGNKKVSVQHLPYQPGNPSFEFVVRPYESTRVTFESRSFEGCFLSVDQSGTVAVRKLPPDSGEVQFAVRMQRFNGPYTTRIMCPFGRDSIVNRLRDRSVIQLYSKQTQVYLALADGGGVVGMTDADHKNTYLVYCDRGLGRVSLKSHKADLLKLKMKFNGDLTGLGAEDLNNDFYLKENLDGTVIFESVPNKGRFITIPFGNELLRNFSVNLVEFTREKGKRAITTTKYHLN